MDIRTLTGSALLLGLALLAQSLRFMIPMHAASMFFIGTMVGACTAIAVWRYGLKSGVLISIVTPIMALIQGMLTIPLFVPIVALGGISFAIVMKILQYQPLWVITIVGAVVKCLVLYGGFILLFMLMPGIPEAMQVGVLFSMGWPQLVTGACGTLLAYVVNKRFTRR